MNALLIIVVGASLLAQVERPVDVPSDWICVESAALSTPARPRYGETDQRWVSPDELPRWSRTIVGGGRLGWPCGRPNDPF